MRALEPVLMSKLLVLISKLYWLVRSLIFWKHLFPRTSSWVVWPNPRVVYSGTGTGKHVGFSSQESHAEGCV